MAVPEFQNFMLPILKLFGDKQTHNINECKETVIEYFQLSEEDIKSTVQSGNQTQVTNRVNWSLTYLKKSLLISTVKRGEFMITKRGLDLLQTNPERIDKKLLSQYKEYRVFSNQDTDKSSTSSQDNPAIKATETTPEESIGITYEKIKEQLADDLLELILEKDPYYFERLVIDVLNKMGYGASFENSSIVTKKSGDEGIDGIINQDRLGLDKIYIQAKRWTVPVGRPELQKFVGALEYKKSNKGIFITTSNFTNDALKYAKDLPTLVLINGKELANLMIEYNVGVQTNYSYEIKKIDNDYFELI